MRKLMVIVAVMLIAAVSVFAGGSGETTYRILSGTGPGTPSYDAVNDVIEQYKAEVNPNFNVEWEVIANTSDLWQKLQMYNTANDLPAIFSINNGAISEEMIKQGRLLNITELFAESGHSGDMVDSLVDYFTSEDGQLYMFPSGFNSEFFVYRKPVFEKYGLSVPKTWEEFLAVCETLKQNGEIPYVMRGADYVQYLRFLSFPTWTTYGHQFIFDLLAGKFTYTESDLGLYAAELMQKLGQGDYFVPGYENMELTDVVDTFMSGTGVMMYANSSYVNRLSDLYDSGEIGFFGVPVVEGREGTGSTIPTHGGKAWAINASMYEEDEVLQDFIAYLFDNLDEAYYANGTLSWYKSEIPDGAVPDMLADLAVEMQKQTVSWVSWDDKLSAATTTAVGDAGAMVAYGNMTPEEFCAVFDSNLQKNDL